MSVDLDSFVLGFYACLLYRYAVKSLLSKTPLGRKMGEFVDRRRTERGHARLAVESIRYQEASRKGFSEGVDLYKAGSAMPEKPGEWSFDAAASWRTRRRQSRLNQQKARAWGWHYGWKSAESEDKKTADITTTSEQMIADMESWLKDQDRP